MLIWPPQPTPPPLLPALSNRSTAPIAAVPTAALTLEPSHSTQASPASLAVPPHRSQLQQFVCCRAPAEWRGQYRLPRQHLSESTGLVFGRNWPSKMEDPPWTRWVLQTLASQRDCSEHLSLVGVIRPDLSYGENRRTSSAKNNTTLKV